MDERAQLTIESNAAYERLHKAQQEVREADKAAREASSRLETLIAKQDYGIAVGDDVEWTEPRTYSIPVHPMRGKVMRIEPSGRIVLLCYKKDGTLGVREHEIRRWENKERNYRRSG